MKLQRSPELQWTYSLSPEYDFTYANIIPLFYDLNRGNRPYIGESVSYDKKKLLRNSLQKIMKVRCDKSPETFHLHVDFTYYV